MKSYLVCLSVAINSMWMAMPIKILANPQTQVDAKVALERSIKSNLGSNGEYQPLIVSLKQWLGNYQKIQSEGSNYLAIFTRGSVPISVQFRDDRSIKSYGMGCPIVTKSLSVSQAHPDLQKLLSKCPNLK
jgi:hypothetical protein